MCNRSTMSRPVFVSQICFNSREHWSCSTHEALNLPIRHYKYLTLPEVSCCYPFDTRAHIIGPVIRSAGPQSAEKPGMGLCHSGARWSQARKTKRFWSLMQLLWFRDMFPIPLAVSPHRSPDYSAAGWGERTCKIYPGNVRART
jgi:hypothetical protein